MNAIKRLIGRLYCKHQSSVWLCENAVEPKSGVYPVRCCLDCGKLIWAKTTVEGGTAKVEYLTPVTVAQMGYRP
ncbi:hypothetical protein P2T68_17055 [Pseudomonas sp. G11]|uniref:hypothetical protein n=1 Tax=Pseudomonas sp. G11 TaxID=528343 RepID=UPI00240275DD|nr:hypothetical protein [Pseudomonas sp. G11]WEX18954.1 hypothetical protein P2T68_17055 [Pseudomonas sp. G11]